MRRINLFKIFFLLAFMLMGDSIANAYDFEYNGIYYNKNGSEATVTNNYNGISSYNCNAYSGNVIIPASFEYNGGTYTVTAIGYEAFYQCYNLYNIVIPNTVTRIETRAFWKCSNLVDINIPNSVTDISGTQTFAYCSSLTSITLPNSMTVIGEHTFEGCSGLKSVTIPNSITTIGEFAFWNCSGLTSIDIPNSVLKICSRAFEGCSGLTSIHIPKSVKIIEELPFLNCGGLTSITVDSENPKYDSRNNCNAIIETATNKLLEGCVNTIIPNSVTEIGNNAFYEYTGLTSITIPNSVTLIGFDAFNGCSSLSNVNIPNSVTKICSWAFSNCRELTSVTIGNSVTEIGNGVFCNCNLEEIYCLATVPPLIGEHTFSEYINGSFIGKYDATLYVPKGSENSYKAADYWENFLNVIGVSIIDDFEVDGIYYHALSENTATVIKHPEIENYYCNDVVIPDNVTYQDMQFAVVGIDDRAFEDCYELTSVVIGDAVETIGEEAFQGCTGLTSVTIGSGVTTIGAKAFNYCNALQTVTCKNTVPPVMASSNCFSTAAYSKAVLMVPRQYVEAYALADYWYKFNNIEGYGSAGLGDVNADGKISIADVTALINLMLSDGEYNPDGDFNYNGKLDIGDVTTLIDYLLSSN